MSDFNREDWLKLASSTEKSDQLQALEMAANWQNQLQKELAYWFGCNTSARHRFSIYELLDEQHRELALSLIDDAGELSAFDRIEAFDEFKLAEEIEMQQAIIHLERWYMKPNDNFRNALYLEYKNRKGCTMDQAKLAVNRLFVEEPGQSGDDFEGGGRAPDSE